MRAEYAEAYEQAHPTPPIENVRFVHDPGWRKHAIMSVQSAHDRAHPFWKIVGFLFFGAQFTYYAVIWPMRSAALTSAPQIK